MLGSVGSRKMSRKVLHVSCSMHARREDPCNMHLTAYKRISLCQADLTTQQAIGVLF